MSAVMTAGIAIPPDVARAISALRAEFVEIAMRQNELIARRDKIRSVLDGLEGLYGPASSNGHKDPDEKPKRTRTMQRRWSDEGVRDLFADVDLSTGASINKQLRVMGVPAGTVHNILARARKLGLLDGLDPQRVTPVVPAREHPDKPIVRPAAKTGKPRRKLDEAWLRCTWAALDCEKPLDAQLRKLGLSGSVIHRQKLKATALGLTIGSPAQNGNGEPTPEPSEAIASVSGNGSAPAADVDEDDTNPLGHVSWAQANAPLAEAKVAKGPMRPSTALVLGCLTCEYTCQTAGEMIRHTRAQHGRAPKQVERTPLTATEAAERGVA